MSSSSFQQFRKYLPQLVAGMAGSINLLSDGMHYGWSAPTIPLLRLNETHLNLHPDDEIRLETIYLVGTLFGQFVALFMTNKLGAKNSIIVSSAFSLISWLLIGLATRKEHLFVARFIVGVTVCVSFVASPIYVTEIAHQRIRGFLAGFVYVNLMLGILVIYSVAPFAPLYVPSLIAAALLILQLSALFLMPESPYRLVGKSEIQEVRKALKRLRAESDNEDELEEICRTVAREKKERGGLRDLLLVPKNRKAFVIIFLFNFAQHFTGFTIVVMNFHVILIEAKSIYFDANTTAIVTASIMFATVAIASFYVEKFGRKFLMVASCLLAGICILILGVYFNLKNLNYPVADVSWLPFAVLMTYAVAFNVGLGLVTSVISPELLSPNVKSIGLALSDGLYGCFGYASIQFYQAVVIYGQHYPFYIFGGCGILMAVYFAWILPETSGKTVEEIQKALELPAAIKLSLPKSKTKNHTPRKQDKHEARSLV